MKSDANITKQKITSEITSASNSNTTLQTNVLKITP